MAEGAPLLREYRVYSSIEGSNPSLSAIIVFVGNLGSKYFITGYRDENPGEGLTKSSGTILNFGALRRKPEGQNTGRYFVIPPSPPLQICQLTLNFA